VSLWTISFSYCFSLLIHLFNFGQLWSGKRASTNNNNRSIKHIWTVDSVNAIVSWPVEHFCCTRKFTVRELEINERTISTSQGLAKVVCPLVLNSIMCVYLDGRLRGALQLTLKSSDTLSYRWSYYLELVKKKTPGKHAQEDTTINAIGEVPLMWSKSTTALDWGCYSPAAVASTSWQWHSLQMALWKTLPCCPAL